MLRTASKRTRTLSAFSAAVATLGALLAVPTSASADVAPAELSWKISQQYVDNFAGNFGQLSATDGATFDNTGTKNITWGSGTGWFDPATGRADIQYKGTVRGAFVVGGNLQYAVTVKDPQILVDNLGKGQVKADVGWEVPSATPATGSTDDVVVTTFDAAKDDWTAAAGLSSLTDTPDWAGVLPAGSEQAVALGITNPAHPVDGKAFAPSFLAALSSGVRAHFYATGAASDPKKNPATFTAAVAQPATEAEVATESPTSVTIDVSGSGFAPTGNGIYVAVAPVDGFSPTDASVYSGAQWLNAGALAGGSFTRTLTLTEAEIAALDRTKEYAVWTLKAHGAAATDTSQTTSTPITLDWDALKATPTVTIDAPNVAYGTQATITITVPGATGRVAVRVDGAEPKFRQLVDGVATLKLPANTAVGRHAIKATYRGDESHTIATAKGAVWISKAKLGASVLEVTTVPTATTTGLATLTVNSSGAQYSGPVTFALIKGGVVKRAIQGTVTNGTATVVLPKIPGNAWWHVRATITANDQFLGMSKTVRITPPV